MRITAASVGSGDGTNDAFFVETALQHDVRFRSYQLLDVEPPQGVQGPPGASLWRVPPEGFTTADRRLAERVAHVTRLVGDMSACGPPPMTFVSLVLNALHCAADPSKVMDAWVMSRNAAGMTYITGTHSSEDSFYPTFHRWFAKGVAAMPQVSVDMQVVPTLCDVSAFSERQVEEDIITAPIYTGKDLESATARSRIQKLQAEMRASYHASRDAAERAAAANPSAPRAPVTVEFNRTVVVTIARNDVIAAAKHAVAQARAEQGRKGPAAS